MSQERVSVKVPGMLKYCHFVSDTSELLFKSKINFYTEEFFSSFIQDMRIVMYELFSNSVAHSKSEWVTVLLDVFDEYLSVTIQTTNSGFGIKEVDRFIPGTTEHPIMYPPYAKELLNAEMVVYRDFEHEVKCKIVGEYAIQFTNHKNIFRKGDVFDIPEHYGLNLITRLTHESYYFRDQEGIDNFVIIKRLR